MAARRISRMNNLMDNIYEDAFRDELEKVAIKKAKTGLDVFHALQKPHGLLARVPST